MKLGQGVGVAFWASLISGGLSGIFTYIYASFIDTGLSERLIENANEAVRKNAGGEEQGLQLAYSMNEAVYSPFGQLISLIIGGVIIGVIIGLIISAILKNDRPPEIV